MPIPGLKPRYETRAKVRIGEKREMQGGRSRPAAVDHFLCDDAEFLRLAGPNPKTLNIRFVHDDAEEAFKTGMEWWMGALQACASDGDGTALRKATIEKDGRTLNLIGTMKVLDPKPIGNDRRRIECPFRACPDFGSNAGNKKCRVMGRLFFALEGQQGDGVYQLDTKSWNSIEDLTGALKLAASRGPLTGRSFQLSVAFQRKGTDRFPVLSIQEADVEPNSPSDMGKVDALLAIDRGLAEQRPPREVLAAALDQSHPGWREREDVVEKIKEVGPAVALQNMRSRLEAELAV